MSMCQKEDDVAMCDMADNVDVSFHMLSHKVRGTKIKKQFVEGPNPKIYRKLHLLPSFPLLHDLQHILIKLHTKPIIHQQTSTHHHRHHYTKNSMKTHLAYLKVKSKCGQ